MQEVVIEELTRHKCVYFSLFFQSFFGGIKLKSVIGFDKVAEIVHKADAPSEVLETCSKAKWYHFLRSHKPTSYLLFPYYYMARHLIWVYTVC